MIPTTLIQNLVAIYGDKGRSWLDDLPNFLESLETRLQLRILEPFPNLTFHYVCQCLNDMNDLCVLKCGLPNPELTHEVNALKFFQSRGFVELIAGDPEEGWLLIEHCDPGESLRSLHDDSATHIAVQTMQQYWQPCNDNNFPHIEDWLSRFDRERPAQISKKDFNNARTMRDELLASQGETVLLHGDLHHDNILNSMRQPYLAIDPKGIRGEREYEFGALLRNPLDVIAACKDLKTLTKRRIDMIVEMTGLDRERINNWHQVQLILSKIWNIDDGISQ